MLNAVLLLNNWRILREESPPTKSPLYFFFFFGISSNAHHIIQQFFSLQWEEGLRICTSRLLSGIEQFKLNFLFFVSFVFSRLI